MDDIFALEDGLTNAVVAMLSKHLSQHSARTPAAPPLRRDVPANPKAFELFLRGMEHARQAHRNRAGPRLVRAGGCGRSAVCAGVGGAWPLPSRLRQVLQGPRANDRLAETAFERALELSPDLPLAHRYLTHFESEGGRAGEAIVRLLRHAATNRHDAQLFAGLVHACRYAGLLDASIAAHDEAVRLDPNVATGVEYTIAHLRDGVQKAAQLTSPRAGFLDGIFPAIALGDPGTHARC